MIRLLILKYRKPFLSVVIISLVMILANGWATVFKARLELNKRAHEAKQAFIVLNNDFYNNSAKCGTTSIQNLILNNPETFLKFHSNQTELNDLDIKTMSEKSKKIDFNQILASIFSISVKQ